MIRQKIDPPGIVVVFVERPFEYHSIFGKMEEYFFLQIFFVGQFVRSACRAGWADRTVTVFSVGGCEVFIPGYLSQNVTFGHGLAGMMLYMNQNVRHRLLLIRVTEIVEVTETITILIENFVLPVGSGSVVDESESNVMLVKLSESLPFFFTNMETEE